MVKNNLKFALESGPIADNVKKFNLVIYGQSININKSNWKPLGLLLNYMYLLARHKTIKFIRVLRKLKNVIINESIS